METLDNETQMIAVEKVLEEMQKAEEYVKNWNACWYEQLLDAHCLPLHYELVKLMSEIWRENMNLDID